MIELPPLYTHQEELRDRTRTALAKHGQVILCANPGFGKTRTAKWILGTAANKEPGERSSGRSLFAVHRRGLVQNAIDSFEEAPRLPHGVIMSGMQAKYGSRTQIASIDSLLSWFVENERYTTDLTFDLVIFDECHAHHPKLAKFLKYHNEKREALGKHPAYLIGLSATPQAKGLADVYKEIVLGPSTAWLTANGFLAPYRYFRGVQGKLGLLVKRGNEFTSDSEAAAMDGLAGDLVRDWRKFADGRPTIGFFPRRQHAKDAMALLEADGVRVRYVDGETEDVARKTMFSQLNSGQIDYICNVQVVERGTDIPRIGCVQLCVCIGSVVRYRQMVGRGSRIHPEKTDCLVLDHGGNILRHGFFEDDPPWTLDRSERETGEVGQRPTIECPKCQAVYRGGKCRNCGYEPTPKERKGQGLDFDGTELKEIKPEKKQVAVKTAEDLMISALYMSGRAGRTWRQCCGIFGGLCKKQGTPEYRIPSSVTVNGRRYSMVRAGSLDGGYRVSQLYPFTVSRGSHGGKYLQAESQAQGSAW